MSDDPTRIMRDDDGYGGNGRAPIGPEDQQRHLRYLIIGLLAVIAGLIIAVIIISGSDSSDNEQTGATDTPAVTDTAPEVVTPAPTGDTGSTGETTSPDTDSGGVAPEPAPDSGTTTDSGGTTPGNSGGVSPESNGSAGDQSGGISP